MKTTIRILMLSGLLALMVFFSCDRNNNATPNPSKSDTVAIAAFPNQIGDSWTYSVFDSITLKTQTVVVKITGDTVFSNNEKFKVWEYFYPDKRETVYVNIVGDTVNFNFKYGFYNTKYIFPLFFGKSWLSGKPGINPPTIVENVESLTLPAGTFNDCYQIKTTLASYNYVLITTNWFMPGVGFVQKHIFERNLGLADVQTWKLEKYTVVNQN